MIEFFNKLFGRQSSGATAKERLRLVLMSDHLSLAPEMIDAMKRDLVDVISRYVEVDRDRIDVHFEHQDKALAMLANIPITGVARNNGNGSGGSKTEDTAVAAVGHSEAEVESQTSAPAPAPRRRRRRKSAQHNGGTQPQTGSPAPAT
jgi:cell division topological specificity factor